MSLRLYHDAAKSPVQTEIPSSGTETTHPKETRSYPTKNSSKARDFQAEVEKALHNPTFNPPIPPDGKITQITSITYNYEPLREWAKTNPEAALQWIENLRESSDKYVPDKISLFTRPLSVWAQKDPKALNAWSEKLPEGKVRDLAFGLVTDSLPSNDIEAAKKRAEQLPEDGGVASPYASRTYALGRVAYYWMKKDNNPEAVAEWAEKLPEGKGRDVAMICLAQEWLKSNPADAKKGIGNSSLSQAEKDKLLK